MSFLKSLIKLDTQRSISEVLNGEVDEIDLIGAYPDEVNDYIEEKTGVKFDSDNFDTNGWDYDFWLTYTIDGKEFELRGSGFYGNLKFSKVIE